MQNPYIITILYFIPPIIIGVFYLKALSAYRQLCRKKENPDYPSSPQDMISYLYNGSLSPFTAMETIFARHKDKGLASAVKKVRILFLSYIAVSILELLIFAVYLFTRNP